MAERPQIVKAMNSSKPININAHLRDKSAPVIWTGNLDDDCTAKWAGLTLRAEWMDEDRWWWCVYDTWNDGLKNDSSNNHRKPVSSGESARKLAEDAAFRYLNLQHRKGI